MTRVQFCVGYTTDGVEYWDANDGANFSLLSARAGANPPTIAGCTRGPVGGLHYII